MPDSLTGAGPRRLETQMSAPKSPQSEACPQPRSPQLPDGAAMPLQILQLTDPHLFAEPDGKLLGLTTRLSFEAVLDLALTHQPRPQALILTGDLVQDEQPAGYTYLRQRLEATGLPHYCIPGNHDQRAAMHQWLGASAMDPLDLRRLGSWNLVFLDSSHPGRDSGTLGGEQIDRLDSLLSAQEAPTLIFLHHHPLPVGSAWMDTMGVENGTALLSICDRHPQIKGVVFGHVHQAFRTTRGGCQILGAPSTCIQFRPGSAEFAVDERPPGYRALDLYPDGRLSTRVVRLPHYPESPLQSSQGY